MKSTAWWPATPPGSGGAAARCRVRSGGWRARQRRQAASNCRSGTMIAAARPRRLIRGARRERRSCRRDRRSRIAESRVDPPPQDERKGSEVEISGFSLRRRPSRELTRCCISAAALLVNVTARIRDGRVPRRISSAIRRVTTRVFPVPAPANTSSGPEVVSTASFWAGFSSIELEIPFTAKLGSATAGRRKGTGLAGRASHPPEGSEDDSAAGAAGLEPAAAR